MKIIKWTLGILLVLVLGVVSVAAFVIFTFDPEQYRDRIEAEAFKATGRTLTLAGPMDLKISLSPTLVVEDATLANAEWGSRSEMVSFERLEFSADLLPLINGKVKINKLVLIGADILIETGPGGVGNWEFEPPESVTDDPEPSDGPVRIPTGDGPATPSESRDFAISVDSLIIRDSVFTYLDGETGKETKIQIASLEGSAPDLASPISLALEAVVDGKPIALNGTIGAINTMTGAPFPVDIEARAGGAVLAIKGIIADLATASGIDLDIFLEGEELGDLNDLAGGGIPYMGAYRVRFHVSQTGSIYEISALQLGLAGSDISGTATISVHGRPSITAQLTSSLLDIPSLTGGSANGGAGGSTAVAPAPSGQGGGSSSGSSRYVLSEDPLPFDALGFADANVSLSVNKLNLDGQLSADNVDLTLILSAGNLRITPLSLDLSTGGHITLWTTVNSAAAHPTVALKIDGDGLDYGRLLAIYGEENSFGGTLNFDADLSGAGTSLHAIGASLNGPIKLRGENGTIDNRWLKLLTGGVSDILGPLFGNQRTATLHCVLFDAQAQDGVIAASGIALDSEVFTLFGRGSIDLRDESLDLHFSSGTRKIAITSLVPPFNVTGTLNDPKVRPDVVGAVSGIVRALGSAINPQNILSVFTGDGGNSTSDTNSCARAIEEAAKPAAASPIDGVTETVGNVVGGAVDTLRQGLDTAIESGRPSNIEDAAKNALEGIKGLFGR